MKRNRAKRKVKTKILLRYLLSVVIVTILWFLFFTFFDLSGITFIYDFLSSRFTEAGTRLIEHYIYSYLLPIGVYCILLFIITLIFFIRSSKFPDRIYDSVSEIIENDYKSSLMPSVIRAKHTRIVNNIKTDIERKEYLLKESEKRKSDLIVYLAHDLKTPLTSIIGYLTLLEEAPELPAQYKAKYTNITLEKAYRLEQLINEFFDITRFNLQSTVLEKNRIDLSLMLTQLAEEFYPTLSKKGLTVKLLLEEHINIIGDSDKLARVFDNLLRNASSYSYENTEIQINTSAENGNAVIAFSNIGDEIPEQKLKLIFEKFFRLDSARGSANGGAGLGLAIAKDIVEMHGGTITADSNRNQTTFKVVLPNVIKS